MRELASRLSTPHARRATPFGPGTLRTIAGADVGNFAAVREQREGWISMVTVRPTLIVVVGPSVFRAALGCVSDPIVDVGFSSCALERRNPTRGADLDHATRACTARLSAYPSSTFQPSGSSPH